MQDKKNKDMVTESRITKTLIKKAIFSKKISVDQGNQILV